MSLHLPKATVMVCRSKEAITSFLDPCNIILVGRFRLDMYPTADTVPHLLASYLFTNHFLVLCLMHKTLYFILLQLDKFMTSLQAGMHA